jgi:hypothetical protein
VFADGAALGVRRDYQERGLRWASLELAAGRGGEPQGHFGRGGGDGPRRPARPATSLGGTSRKPLTARVIARKLH